MGFERLSERLRIDGNVEETLQTVHERYVGDIGFDRAQLTVFEDTFGISPAEAVDGIVEGAAEKCRIRECGLSAEVEDSVVETLVTGEPPNEFAGHKDRVVSVKVTCQNACSRLGCQEVIEKTSGRVKTFLQEAANGVPQAAKAAHMRPVEDQAAQIKADADAEAERLLAEATSKLDAVGTTAVAAFLDRYGLTPTPSTAE